MNRRVFMTVTDGRARRLSLAAASATRSKTLKDLYGAQKKCCDEILKRLDKLDEIADMLQKMTGENNDALRKNSATSARRTTLSIST